MLDTNICIYLMDNTPTALEEKFAQYGQEKISINAITWAELCCGLDIQNSQDDMMDLLLYLSPKSFDMAAAAIFGRLSQQFRNKKAVLAE